MEDLSFLPDQPAGNASETPNGSPQPVDLSFLPDQPDEGEQLRQSLYQAVRTNPDQYAEARKLSGPMGLPATLIDRNFPDAELKARFQALQDLAKSRPVLGKAFQDHDFAMLAHDDTDSLSAIEDLMRNTAFGRTVRFFGDFGAATASGLPQFVAGTAYGTLQAGFDVAASVAEPLTGTLLPENPFQRGAEWAAEMRRREMRRSQDWMPDTDSAIAQGIFSGAQSLGQSLLTLPAAVATGNPWAALAPMGLQTGGLEYGRARDAGRSVGQSQVYGLTQGAIEVGTELLPTLRFLGDLKAGSGFLKTFLGQLATEIPGEQAATALQDFEEWAVLHPEKPFSDYVSSREGAMLQTALATAVATGGQTAVFTAADRAGRKLLGGEARTAAAEQDAGALGELVKLAGESKLRERSPETLAQFLDQAAHAGGAPADLYFDARSFAQTIQDGGGDLAKLAQVMPSVAEQIGPALEAGADLRIPVGEFAANLAGTGLESKLVDHARMSEEGLSAAEAREAGKRQQADLQAELEKMAAEMGATEPTGAQAVEDDLTGQLRAVGFEPSTADAYARLYTAGIATLAERAGVDPLDLHQRYGLTVVRPMPDVLKGKTADIHLDPLLDRLRRGERPTQTEIWGPSLVEALRAAGGLRDDGGELAARDVDVNLKPFTRRMIRPEGMTLDHAAEWAMEKGYIPERNPDALLAAIDDELQGNPHHAPNAGNPALADLAATLDQLDEYLQRLGVDLHQVDNAGARAALREAARGETGLEAAGKEYGQGETYTIPALDALKSVMHGGEGAQARFRHPLLGDITLDYGSAGNPEKGYRGGSGAIHMLARRMSHGRSGARSPRKYKGPTQPLKYWVWPGWDLEAWRSSRYSQ